MDRPRRPAPQPARSRRRPDGRGDPPGPDGRRRAARGRRRGGSWRGRHRDAGAPRRTTTKRKRSTSSRAKKSAPRAASEPPRAEPVDRRTTEPEQPAMAAEDVADAIVDAAREVFGSEGWERRLAEMLAFVRRRVTGDYEVDEFGFDIEVTETFLLTALRPLAEKWFRIEVHGIDNIPAEGGALVVSNHSGTVPIDGLMTGLVIHDHADRLPAHARGRPGLPAAVRRRAGPQGWRDAGQQRGRRADALARRPGRRLAGGLQGDRQAVLRALQAPAVRPWRLRLGGAAHRGSDRAVLGGGCRGDLPAGRQHPVARATARRALHPDHAVLPVAGPARA